MAEMRPTSDGGSAPASWAPASWGPASWAPALPAMTMARMAGAKPCRPARKKRSGRKNRGDRFMMASSLLLFFKAGPALWPPRGVDVIILLQLLDARARQLVPRFLCGICSTGLLRRRIPLPHARQGDAVADRDQGKVDPGIVPQLEVQGPY